MRLTFGRTGTALSETQTADTTGRDVAEFRTDDRMSEVLGNDRQGFVSPLNCCDLMCCVDEDLSNVLPALKPRY